VLRRHDSHHILLEAAYQDASTGLLDIGRLAAFLARIKGRIRHSPLKRVSPLAVPLIVELGRESVHGASAEALLREAAEMLIAEALDAEPVEPESLEAG
jgi:ATP-dependent Lhr-like helicase